MEPKRVASDFFDEFRCSDGLWFGGDEKVVMVIMKIF